MMRDVFKPVGITVDSLLCNDPSQSAPIKLQKWRWLEVDQIKEVDAVHAVGAWRSVHWKGSSLMGLELLKVAEAVPIVEWIQQMGNRWQSSWYQGLVLIEKDLRYEIVWRPDILPIGALGEREEDGDPRHTNMVVDARYVT